MELDAKTIYYLAWRDVLRDGRSEKDERATLERLRIALGLSQADASEVFQAVKEARSQRLEEAEPMDTRGLFAAACRVAWADGVVELAEASRLTDLADALGIDLDAATEIFEGCGPG